MRLALTTAVCIALLGLTQPSNAQETRLPDIGSSAGSVLSPSAQEQYGQMLLSQLRHYDYTIEDPLANYWVTSLGNRLAATSDKPEHGFTFFLMNDRQVNAFATLGGYVGLNAGLVLIADSEDEVAGVLSHEIAHVTQQHVLRSVERAQRDSIPILLAMLGAIAVAASSNSDSSANGAMAAIAGAQGLAAQRQIDYTRSNESEADRIGIRALARSGYDPEAMAKMFERMQALERGNRGGDKESVPDYLRTHPVTTTRIAEAKQRASAMGGETTVFTPARSSSSNLLLPVSFDLNKTETPINRVQFGWIKERLRVLTANTYTAAIRDYQRLGDLSEAQRYGLAFAQVMAGQAKTALSALEKLSDAHPDDLILQLSLGQAYAKAGQNGKADQIFTTLLSRNPSNRPAVIMYANVLTERNTKEAGKRAQDILRPLLASSTNDPQFHLTFARANEIAGDSVRAGEAYAEAAYLNGRPEQALIQLNTLKRRDDLDYYARARIESRIAAITPTILELRRQGVKDRDLERR